MKNWFDAVSDMELVGKSQEVYPETNLYFEVFAGIIYCAFMDSLNGYTAEILIGTGHQPTIVLGLLEKYLRSKYRNAIRLFQ